MKIAYTGLNLPEGKVKYQDQVFVDLVEKFQPAKQSPYYFEFLPEAYEAADAIAVAAEQLLDVLLLDMEKIESRLSRAEDPVEREALEKCLAHLELEKPLCDLSLTEGERSIVNRLGLLSAKPTLIFEETSPVMNGAATNGLVGNNICRDMMAKAAVMFFYTAGKQEVHAWIVKKGADAVTCAGKIHSDLARGFIKAELVSHADMMTVYNMQDARSKGLARLVDRDYPIPENTILEIRFNV